MKGIYIHIPFCKRKCLYCDFYSITDIKKKEEYINALEDEISLYKGEVADTVFIGGGTPSCLGKDLIKVIDILNKNISITKDCEFTIEVNPATVDLDLLREMKSVGVNRLSIGAQSFNDNELKFLGRIHNAKDIIESYNDAIKAGFDNINLDIMLSIPLQTKESIKDTLDKVKMLDVTHVSAYSLIIEEGTPFYSMDLPLPDEDSEREIYHSTINFFEDMGLKQYEISNFAKQGYECKHNIKYWTQQEYIGFGAGAHSFVNRVRYNNEADIDKYIIGQGRKVDEVPISREEYEKERFLLGLRMTDGIVYRGEFSKKVDMLIKKGLLKIENDRLSLTTRGLDVANIVFMEFI